MEFARKEDFEDEGFSGASLVRPGLERLRDLAAEGQVAAVLVYSPDRLSRKYAYQILLTEEFARHGVETVFVKAPKSDTPEDQLLLQFQGMSLGPMAKAPFPISAHRTVGPDFRNTALRLASPQGPQRGRSGQAF
jgi:hypothetical protein